MRTRRLALWGVLLAILICLVAGSRYVESDAEARARVFCDRFPVGSPLADVAAAAADAGDPKYRIIRANQISIAYIGLPPFSRHVCVYEGEAGKVTKAWYRHVD
jgi:hypothetical protein